MRRATLLLISGIYCAALFTAALSVYAFHDIDQAQMGHLNKAFEGLSLESAIFALVIGGVAGLFSWLGSVLLHLKSCAPRPVLAFYLGVGVGLVQYPWDLLVRSQFPKFTESSLLVFLLVAIASCAIILIWDCYRRGMRTMSS